MTLTCVTKADQLSNTHPTKSVIHILNLINFHMQFSLKTPLPPAASRHHFPPPRRMASHLQPLFILFFLTVNHLLTAQTTQFNRGFLLKLTKDLKTHQYTTQLLIGTPQLPTKLVIHLSGQSLWLNCPPSSPSRNFITHGSLQCQMAKSGAQKAKSGQSHTICDIHQRNPITGATNVGDLAEDIVTVGGMRPISTVDRFLFLCSPEFLLKGLVNGAKGVLGFGKSKIAFQSQIVNNFDFPRKFTVCLSSSDGFIISGTGISNSLTYTPLMSSYGVDGYYVNVNSIKINRRRLVGIGGQPIGGVEISSTVPYTVMKSTLYGVFIKAFVTAASAMNMTMVSPVAPFGVCFNSPATVPVPEIELVLQSELVKWRIQGRNSMVEVSDSVMCLGFVDGGLGMNGSMILGGYQLEDHVLEFNLGSGMMGFSSSLLMEGNSCSNIRALVSSSTQRESL